MIKAMFNVLLILAIGAPLLIANVNSSNNKSSDKTYLFDVSHVNYAWGHRYRGYVITSDGYIYSFDRSGEEWQYDDAENIDDGMLMAKYKNLRLFARVEQKELDKYLHLLKSTSSEIITAPTHPCNDFGFIRYNGYLHNSGSGSCNVIKLYQAGDTAWKNLAPQAEKIYRWLNSILYGGKDHPCSYSEND